MTDSPIAVSRLEDGAIWRVAIGGTKGNILDATAMDALTDVFRLAGRTGDLKAICLEGQGAHFSFGASVAEHLPGQVERMLQRFRQLLMTLVDTDIVTLAVVRGQCLGGGLELALLCHRIFASCDARLGQPEVVLGVFAPVASLILPDRIGRARAEDLCISGRVVNAEAAAAIGLVDELCAGDPMEAALDYARKYLIPRSASSLRHVVRAVRDGVRSRLFTELESLERFYLDDLMHTADAIEGLEAFLQKRNPVWKNA